jgi:hypothetical protein
LLSLLCLDYLFTLLVFEIVIMVDATAAICAIFSAIRELHRAALRAEEVEL